MGDPVRKQSGHSTSPTWTSSSERHSVSQSSASSVPSTRETPWSADARDHHSMASASVISPTYSSSRSATGLSISHMLSSGEQRRASGDDEPSVRHSLPPISEVISGTNSQYAPASSTSSALAPASGLPAPFSSSSGRPYSDNDPRTSPHLSSYQTRQEPLPPFPETSHSTSYSGRPGLPSVSERRTSPPKSNSQPHSHADRPIQSSAYSNAQPPSHAQLSNPYQNGHLPNGQLQLPNNYNMSARHTGPGHGNSSYEHPRSIHSEDIDNRHRYDTTVNKHFQTWGYQEALKRIGSSSRTVFNFAEQYIQFTGDQGQMHSTPDHLPPDSEVADMLANIDLMKRSVDQVRDIIQASVQSERIRDGPGSKPSFDEHDDVQMYGGESGAKTQFPTNEGKRRRGRAAPPGRCHSCNRMDTPEWRRGPDGARTLCNACGLHYAKIERKRQLEARSAKPDER